MLSVLKVVIIEVVLLTASGTWVDKKEE